jgi:hypothetical protein
MQTADHAFFNFGDFGHPEWIPVSLFEMQVMWAGSQELVEDCDVDHLERMLDELKLTLLKTAIHDQVDAEWISRAVMVTAIEGHMGKPLSSDRFRLA